MVQPREHRQPALVDRRQQRPERVRAPDALRLTITSRIFSQQHAQQAISDVVEHIGQANTRQARCRALARA
jgi:hypothetical protein